jgi:hypothetical protein
VDSAHERACKRNSAPLNLLRKLAPWAKVVPKGTRVLVAGFDPSSELDAALSAAGLLPTHWRRFACGGTDEAAAPWPALVADGGYGACLVRWPWYAAGDAAAMTLRACASVARERAPVWVCGNLDEGIDGGMGVIGTAYGHASEVGKGDGAVVLMAVRGLVRTKDDTRRVAR